MSNGSLTRLLIYLGIALLTHLMDELAGIKQFSDKTPVEWLVTAGGSVLAALLVWRAYIDQHISREPQKENAETLKR